PPNSARHCSVSKSWCAPAHAARGPICTLPVGWRVVHLTDAAPHRGSAHGAPMRFVRWFKEVGLDDVGLVGGKVASLGEMIRELSPLGIRVPDGFALTAEAYRHFIAAAGIDQQIRELLEGISKDDVHALVGRT